MTLRGIRTATLRSDVALGFDVYLLISGKHLLYVKRPDPIEGVRLVNLKDKNVRQVYIEESDLKNYEKYLDGQASAALRDVTLPLVDRATIIGGQSLAAVEDMFESPERRENYEQLRSAAANQVALLLHNPEALEQLLAVARYDRNVYQHSVNVAAISVGMAAGLSAPLETCNALGIGGLLHDIGKSQMALNPNVSSAELQQHPRVGAGLLLNKKYVSRDVLDIILLHEERLDGKGYPSGVRKLDQIFQVVGLANLYDRLVTLEGIAPTAAFAQITAMDPAPYAPELIEALRGVLLANKVISSG